MSTNRRKPLAPDEHRALGRELYDIRNRLLDIGVEIANRHGKTKRASKLARRMHKAVDSVRCALDDQFASDHPAEFSTKVYYAGTASVESERVE